MFKIPIICVCFLFSTHALCDEEVLSDSVSTKAVNDQINETFRSRMSYFLTTVPLPILSSSVGVGAEFLVNPWISFWTVYSREKVSTEDGVLIDLSLFDEELRSDSHNISVATRFYNPLSDRWWKGFFVSTGYKWIQMNNTYSPALFGGRSASHKEREEGFFAGLGYRIQSQQSRFVLLLDIGVNWEPGRIRDVRYESNGTTLFGSNPQGVSTLDYNISYGFKPDIKVGIRF